MSEPTSTPTRRVTDVAVSDSIPVFYRLLLRGQLTRGRMIGLGLLSAVAVLTGFLSRRAEGIDGSEGAALFAIGDFGIGIFVPLAALMLAIPMLGNLVEDRLLVYLWMKPTPRWHLAVAALGAVATVVVAITVLPVFASALVAGFPSLAGPAALATLLGALAYSSLYLWLGLRFSWGLWLGMAYLVLWENLFARLGDGTARLSVRSYLLTILEGGTDRSIDLADRAPVAAVVVPLVVAAVALFMTARTLQRRDVE